MAEDWVEGLPGEAVEETAPTGAVDRARFWLATARRLWDTDAQRRLASVEMPGEASLMVGALATTHLSLEGQDQISVAGVELEIGSDRGLVTAWPQVLEWERGEVTADALRYLISGKIPDGEATIDQSELPPGVSEPPDAELARGLTTALVREAEERATYAPSGGFVLALPDGYPLRAWGVSELRVWAEPDRLWVAALDETGQPSASFVWFPGEPLSRLVASGPAAPLAEVTLAALWRDLRVGGGEAVPASGKRARRRERREQAGAIVPPSEVVVRDPSDRPVRVTGKRTWGRREEHRAIQRRAHGVRGHLRRLQPGAHASDEAREIAGDFGVVVPDGYTFVRPHVRGEGEGDVAAEVVVRARGLATVMALLG